MINEYCCGQCQYFGKFFLDSEEQSQLTACFKCTIQNQLTPEPIAHRALFHDAACEGFSPNLENRYGGIS